MAEVCFHSFQIKLFPLNVLLNLSIQFFATRDNILRDREMKSTLDAIFTCQLLHGRGEQSMHVISFPLYKQGTDARRFHYLLGIAVLEQGIEMCCHWLSMGR